MRIAKIISGAVLIFIGSIWIFVAVIIAIAFGGIGMSMKLGQEMSKAESESFAEDAVQTTGEIIDTNGSTTVEYYVASEDAYYEITLPVVNSEFTEGDTVTVYYDEDFPDEGIVPEIADKTFGMLSSIFSGVGIGISVFLAVFGLILVIIGIVFIVRRNVVPGNQQ